MAGTADPTPVDGEVRARRALDDEIDKVALGDLVRESEAAEAAGADVSTSTGDVEKANVTEQLDPDRTRAMDPTERRMVTPAYGHTVEDGRAPARRPAAPPPAVEPPAPVRRRSWWRRGKTWVLLVLAVIALLVGYYLVTVFQVVMAGRSDDARPSDAIVVLGAAQYDGRPSPQLAARLDHAVDLYDGGVAPTVMVTGGKLPGDRFTEAEASRSYLVDHGVPETAIMMENAGRTTFESLDAAAVILERAGVERVVLVTDPFHTLRSELIAEEVGLDPASSPTPTSVVQGWNEIRRDLVEAGGVAVGRIIGFERLSGLSG